MNHGPDTYYMNPDTQDRIRVTWQVHLSMPATYDGFIEIEADSAEDAARLALEQRWTDVDWDYSDSGDKYSICVSDVDCEEPPEGAVLICPAWNSEASLSSLFEPVTAASAQLNRPWAELVNRARELGVGGEDLMTIEAVISRYAEQQGG